MPKYQIILTAENVDCCPLYKTGDQIVLDFPQVDLEKTNKVCAFVIAELMKHQMLKDKNMICELREEMSDKAEFLDEYGLEEGPITCPRMTTGVSFNLEVKEQEEDISFIHDEMFIGRQDKREMINKLRKIPILSTVTADDLFDALGEIRLKKYEAGETILKKGDKGRSFFIIYNGEVEVVQVYKDGMESVIVKLQSGNCFGEMSLLTNEAVSATIRASVPSTMLSISKEGFRQLMDCAPKMRLMITKLLAQRIKDTNHRVGLVVASGMVGQLHTIAFPELIQTLSSTESNGILYVKSDKKQGNVYFQHGQIVDTELGDLVGEEGFYKMLEWKKGDFRFSQKENLERERTIPYDTMGLLLEGMRRLDEQTRKWKSSDVQL